MEIADILVRDKLPPSLTARKRTAVGESPTAKNSRTVGTFGLQIQDGLLTEKDK